MKTTIIYPGTFDPITNGHIDLINRSLKIFDKVIVAIAQDTQKRSIFSQEERLELAKQALQNLADVEVTPFAGFLVDFAKQCNAQAILRGLRAISDFDYEFQLAGINRQLCPGIETIFLTPSERYTYVSSSMVRWMSELGGDITPFVPKIVERALRKKYA